jgi:hypothetical protein
VKNFRITILLLFFYAAFHAQVDSVYTGARVLNDSTLHKKERNTDWMKSLTYGGNFQVWLGNPMFLFISPTIGYDLIDEKLNAGIGFIYNYTSADYGSYGKITQSVFGGHSYVRYVITEGLFTQLQYDRLHQPNFQAIDPGKKVWVDYILFGGGFRQPIGDKAALTTSIMYNLTPSPLSIYYPNRVVIQFGIVAGF